MVKFFKPDFYFLAPFRLIRMCIRKVNIYEQTKNIQKIGLKASFGVGLNINNAGNMEIGRKLETGNFLQLSTYKDGSIKIGDFCFLGDNCKIVSDNSHISIGQNCLIAEQVSIRASNHGIKLGKNIREQKNTFAPIEIGDDTWIGKGSTILGGAKLPNGCVIGAHSLVLSKSVLKQNCIYGGSPVKYIGKRVS